jgi:hypothetical protein
MNPFPKANPGAYKLLLVQGLQNIGKKTESVEFDNGDMKLAIVSSITGNVRLFPELRDICVNALKTLDDSDTKNYYIWGLENNQFAVASSNGAYVYRQDDEQAVAHVESMLKAESEEIIAPYFQQ